jgi:hypothetical protein
LEQLLSLSLSLAHHADARGSGNVVGIRLYSFGSALRTAHWLQERPHPRPH